MNETLVTMCGNVVADPWHMVTPDGVAITSLRIVSNTRRFDRTQRTWVDGDTTWMTVTCFRGLADNVIESIHKGERVIVQGKLRTRNWEKGDRRGSSTDMIAHSVGHDLTFGRSAFTKVNRSEHSEPGRVEADELATEMELSAELRDPFSAELDEVDLSTGELVGAGAERGALRDAVVMGS